MSRNYSADQYDSAYRPRALRSWEVPNCICDRPMQRSGKTKIIANSRGHILPGTVRPSCNPWGDFVGTWSMPKYISRKMAEVLNKTVSGREKLKSCKLRLLSEKNSKKGNARKAHGEIVGDGIVGVKDEEKNVVKEDSHVEEMKSICNEPPDIVNDEIGDQKKILCPIHDLYQE